MTQAETPVARISFELQPTGAPAIADHGALQGLGDDDHPQYLTGARAAAIFSQKTETAAAVAALQVSIDAAGAGAASALAAHTSAADPHVNYLNQQRGDARYERSTNRNAPDGYAGLDVSGKVPASLLPSYVDDVLEHASTGTLPLTGETGKIYVALDSGKTYRWSGSSYVEISAAPGSTDSVPEGAANLYHTAARVNALIAAAAGVSVQAYNATLSALSGLATQAFGRGLLNLASAAALRTAIALPVATSAGRLARYTDVNGSQGETAGLFEDAGGNVGIGTSAPGAKLHVYSASGTQQLAIGDASGHSTIQQSSSLYINAGANGSGAATVFRQGTGFVEVMRITPAGNVGIGIAAPAEKLDVAGNIRSSRLVLNYPNATANAVQLFIVPDGDATTGMLVYSPLNGKTTPLIEARYAGASTSASLLRIAAGNGSLAGLEVKANGFVGAGTLSPTAQLDNAGDTYRQRQSRTPASATAAGNQGDQCWDANYLYVCVATNTWKRAALSTW